MAQGNEKLINGLRSAARRLSNKENYEWKDLGMCNCGNLIQSLVNVDKKRITREGIKKHGDWEMLSRLYNPDSQYYIDKIITQVLDFGLSLSDLVHLENLTDERIAGRVEEKHGIKFLKRDKRSHVMLYLSAWAELLEEDYANDVEISDAIDALSDNKTV